MAAAQSADDHNNLKECKSDRIPTLEDVEHTEDRPSFQSIQEKFTIPVDMTPIYRMKQNYVLYDHFGYKEDLSRRIALKREHTFYNYCLLSVCLSFVLGLVIGAVVVGSPQSQLANQSYVPRKSIKINNTREITSRSLNSLRLSSSYRTGNDVTPGRDGKFATVSFTGDAHKQRDLYPRTLTDDMREILKDNKSTRRTHSIATFRNSTGYTPNELTVLYENVYWGPAVEGAMPQGYGEGSAELWESYVDQSEVVGMEAGCGRMQNRLVTFRDGVQACVRYRQNTDQIQGEIFSFYVARLLNLTNLAPSVIKVVDLKDKLWSNVASEVGAAQWNTNRAVVLTQYIPSLESATIPDIFKPANRHLNKNDVLNMAVKETGTVDASKKILIDKLKNKNVKVVNKKVDSFDHIDVKLNKRTLELLVELAQWSDLIIFDYLTANLDRIVNNLFNYQWNVNIMDGPAHNLARKMDSGLLLFLDNESGLLHGYRLLKKYNVYHGLMLDNLCVFRRRTVESLRTLYGTQAVGRRLSDMFHSRNGAVIRDILPPLPEKNAKVLHDRIGRVLGQVDKCEQNFANTNR